MQSPLLLLLLCAKPSSTLLQLIELGALQACVVVGNSVVTVHGSGGGGFGLGGLLSLIPFDCPYL